MDLGERTEHIRFPVRDRDAKHTGAFDEVFTSLGARVIKTPVRAPRATVMAECRAGTVRRECTDRLLINNQRHLLAYSPTAGSTTLTTALIEHETDDHHNRPGRQLPPIAPG